MIPSGPFFFFFNDTATTEIYTLSLHDALPISRRRPAPPRGCASTSAARRGCRLRPGATCAGLRSEEHTSELQSHLNLVCRLLLEKKKKKPMSHTATAPAHALHRLTNSARSRGA